jgi:hypothetical protein
MIDLMLYHDSSLSVAVPGTASRNAHNHALSLKRSKYSNVIL